MSIIRQNQYVGGYLNTEEANRIPYFIKRSKLYFKVNPVIFVRKFIIRISY